MDCDILIVGAGPAGLAAAYECARLNQAQKTDHQIYLIEKGSEVGAHILSGAVLDPRALNELIPDWADRNAPLTTAVTDDQFCFLTEKKSYTLPTPPSMHNKGNYIISLGAFCRWLAEQCEALGVCIFPGFPAQDIVYDDKGNVTGVITGDMGVDKAGEPTANYQAGIEIHAQYTLFAEGCRGSLSERLIKRFDLRQQAAPQTYAIGLKELWDIPSEHLTPGKVTHTIGWPLDRKTYGGSFLYHTDKQISLGFVIGLDYQNPYLSPYNELQRFKHHPSIAPLLEGANRVSYGARALNEGGFQSIPQLEFPGGLLIGCSAGFVNVPRIKGSHTAMKSGMLAAQACMQALDAERPTQVSYQKAFEESWAYAELKRVRNIRPAFSKGLWAGLLYAACEDYLFHGKTPWTWQHHQDHQQLLPAKTAKPIHYPKPDGKISFDKMSSVFLSSTNHEENQPCHLQLKDPSKFTFSLSEYDAPEQRYCPAGVYEVVQLEGKSALQINPQNCLHCKTCDIKDPQQNIIWTTPEGGGGPNYPNM